MLDKQTGSSTTTRQDVKQFNASRYSGPANILVLYKSGDSTGQQIAEYYQSKRAIPAANILPCAITWSEAADGVTMTESDCNANLLPQVVAKLAELNITAIVTCNRWPIKVGAVSLFTVLGLANQVSARSLATRYDAETRYSSTAKFDAFASSYDKFNYVSPAYISAGFSPTTRNLEAVPPVNYLRSSWGASKPIIPHFRLEVSPTESTDTRIASPSDLNYVKRIIDDGIAAENAQYSDCGTALLASSGSYVDATQAVNLTTTITATSPVMTGIPSTVGVRPGVVFDSVYSYCYATSGSTTITNLTVTAGLTAGTAIRPYDTSVIPAGTTISSINVAAATAVISAPALKDSSILGVAFDYYFAPAGTTVATIDSATQITLSAGALFSATFTPWYNKVNFGTGLTMGAPSYLELNSRTDVKCKQIYSKALSLDISATGYRNTTYGTGLYVERSTRNLYVCTTAGATSATAVTLTTLPGKQIDGAAVFQYMGKIGADRFPTGATDIENIAGEGGTTFLPISDVFFRSVGVNSYYGGNREPDSKTSFVYRKGAIVVYTQSLSFIPTPTNDRDWDFGYPALVVQAEVAVPATEVTTTNSVSSLNLFGSSTLVFAFYSTRVVPTMQVTTASTIVLRENGATVATITWSNKTGRELFAYVKSVLPVGWSIYTISGNVPSRAMTAIKNGACFTYGSWTEPSTQGAAKTGSLFHNVLAGLSVGEAMFTTLQTMSYYYTLIVGDPLYRPFRHRR